jgi:integrase
MRVCSFFGEENPERAPFCLPCGHALVAERRAAEEVSNSDGSLRRQLYPAMTRAGIPRVGPTQEKRTFHSFRHTFAKRALETGAQITWLSRHLGHSSLKVTTDIYGHWERAERKLQAAKMEGAFSV